ncbi:MAG: GDP-mannose 4,6-dehydratase [Planctomycetota bacterium]|jgi:UDP-glucose 4-epimerase
MEQRRALVTGGAGFIGSHLCDYLIHQNWKVTVIDDLSTGSIQNIRALERHPNFRILIGSATDTELLKMVAAEVDTVFHLAALVGVSKVMEDTVKTIDSNLHSSEAVLKLCNQYRLRLLITSTSEVYGASSKEVFSENDDSIIGPSRHRRWSYAAAKLMDEFHAFAYFYTTALPVTVVRLFNTIGPRQVGHYGMVVPTFVNQALRGEPITVTGKGSQTRCFTAVSDVVRCLTALAESDETVGEVYNVGCANEISILQLAEKIKALTNSDSPITFKSYNDFYGEDFVDMERRVPDTQKLKTAIGFQPDTNLDAILESVIDHLRKTL